MSVHTLSSAVRAHRPLFAATLLSLAVLIVATIGLIVDPREVVGAPIWLKAWKFGVSIAVYTVTIAWMLTLPRGGSRRLWWLGTVIAVLISLENVLIVLQIVRGTMSHFNFRTPFDTAVVISMGIGIVLVWVMNLTLGVMLAFRYIGSASLAAGVRWGVAVSLVGMAVGILMTVGGFGVIDSPGDGIEGAHTVGAADGGPGVAVTGWSTTDGDLRVPHFFGIHALQAIPLVAWLLAGLAPRLLVLSEERTRAALVRIIGLATVGLITILTWQAGRGQSVFRPDSVTIVVVVTVLGAAVISGGIVLLRARQCSSRMASSTDDGNAAGGR